MKCQNTEERGTATSHEKISSPLKWHIDGGKSYLATKIVALIPPHTHYCEPYFGGGSVLFAKDPEGISEVVNDIDYNLTDFWRTLQSPELFEMFRRKIEATPFSQIEWENSCQPDDKWPITHPFEKAVRFFVHCRQSLAGRMSSFAPLSKNRVRRGMNEQASAWLSAIEGLPQVHERLKRVVILCDDAIKVMAREDTSNTLFYLDPSYLPETRTAPNVYKHEMTYEDHERLLDTLLLIKGKALLSGYPNELYNSRLKNWNRVDFDIANHSAGGDKKRRMTECVWKNF